MRHGRPPRCASLVVLGAFLLLGLTAACERTPAPSQDLALRTLALAGDADADGVADEVDNVVDGTGVTECSTLPGFAGGLLVLHNPDGPAAWTPVNGRSDGTLGQYRSASSGVCGTGVYCKAPALPCTPNTVVAEVTSFSPFALAMSLDGDGDGVPDYLDACPGTPAGELIDESGCSCSQLDADADGVSNCDDLCAGSDDTQDADGDGVPDGCDGCPDTPPNVMAGGDGCPLGGSCRCPTGEATALLACVRDTVVLFNLKSGIANALDGKLERALSALEAENAAQRQDAVHHIAAFVQHVEAQRGRVVEQAQADELVSCADEALSLLGGP